MKKLILSLSITLISYAFTMAQGQSFKTFYKKYFTDFNQNPAQAIRSQSSADYQFIGSDHLVRTAEETAKLLDALQNFDAHTENEVIRTYGNTGVVSGIVYMNGTYADGSKRNNKASFIYVFVNGKKGWKQVVAQHNDFTEK